MPRAENVTLWMERLQRFEQSQMTVAQFCAAESVSQPSFYNWKRKLRSSPNPKALWSAPQELMRAVYEGSHKETFDDQEAKTTKA